MKLRPIHVAPLAVFLIAVLPLGVSLFTHKTTAASALVGKPVPAFSLPALQGESLSTEALKGKPYLINVFASWCVSCKIEHPLLVKIAKEKTLPIYGIAWKDAPKDTRQLLKESGNPYTKVGTDAEGNVAILLGISGAPETFLVGADGAVLYRYPGPLTPSVYEEMKALIKG